MKEDGRTIVFTGDGKGKTTAALGLALRACGHGMNVLIIQFVKNDPDTGEITACRLLTGIEMRQAGLGFVPDPSDPSFRQHKEKAEEGLSMAREALQSGKYEMIVLDEVCVAVSMGLLSEGAVTEAIEKRYPGMHVVMTGRGATPHIVESADTVTEMRNVKHGYQEGRKAKKGVEY